MANIVCEIGTHLLRGDFIDDRRYNVLIIGPMGGGKSSLVNCFYTLNLEEHGAVPRNIATAENMPTHVTTEYQTYSIATNLGIPLEEFPFDFFDVWGITKGEKCGLTKAPYEILGIGNFLEGKVPLRTAISELSNQVIVDEIKKGEPNRALEIHGVIIVVPSGSLEEKKDASEWVHFRKCVKDIIVEYHHNPIFVVTNIDKLDFNDKNKGVEVVSQLKAFLEISPQHVLLHENYHSSHLIRNQKIDFSGRKILTALHDVSKDYTSNTLELQVFTKNGKLFLSKTVTKSDSLCSLRKLILTGLPPSEKDKCFVFCHGKADSDYVSFETFRMPFAQQKTYIFTLLRVTPDATGIEWYFIKKGDDWAWEKIASTFDSGDF